MQPAFTASKKQSLRNPEKWIGRSVLHLANWREYQYTDKYFVCAWSGRLYRVQDEALPCIETELMEKHSPFDPCYSYCSDAITAFEIMVEKALGLQ